MGIVAGCFQSRSDFSGGDIFHSSTSENRGPCILMQLILDLEQPGSTLLELTGTEVDVPRDVCRACVGSRQAAKTNLFVVISHNVVEEILFYIHGLTCVSQKYDCIVGRKNHFFHMVELEFASQSKKVNINRNIRNQISPIWR